ncbi:50S ribosomal protein L25 [Rhodonellum psychrophilum GCM71 = DSM 17998]|jgi:large subunit ribosomal protein L25|uniref:Large ribosomal subunit protein bL25 n=2 Tax=Rhodonellum TaxID=336827 RepID=U5C5E5_9BACT|nr:MULTISPECIES: 50S ribosomal protein L25/general stress protein Ctc [Rhodonellum]ERM83402.1 50S ribosomal protein L25 [Rhodonellum psychrophilum GCM71 = DSM 17998]MDO9554609.1 50S ribosomal protein L25/general stress protein Ctc [Rhodonellum sp.]SDZ37914.1 LSU ribosomal protein L25P [Rhodonellum ikkaensis]
MKSLEIIGFKRANLESRELNALREEGNIPCVVYGPGIPEQIHFHSPAILFRPLIYTPHVHMVELNIEGTIIKAILREAQYHPVSENLLHADFLAYSEDKAIKIDIPVVIEGTSPGLQKGGKLEIKSRTLLVKGFAKDLPDTIPVNISHLDLGKSVKVEELTSTGYEILTSPNVSIATIGIPRALRGKKGE